MEYNNTRANEFDFLVGQIEAKQAIKLAGKAKVVLDIGCGIGLFTEELAKHYPKVHGVDLSPENISIARNQCKTNCKYYIGNAETFKADQKYDVIFMMHILEHVDNPVKALKNAKKYLNKTGKLIIQVPNAESFNRILGKKLGIIKDLHELNKEEITKFGHQRVYNIDTLENDLDLAGFYIDNEEGIVFKPFTNNQMQQIMQTVPIDKTLFVEALYEIGKDFPHNCTSICIEAKLQ
jgi:ubiquinone biosynthesis O-methyltransferase